MSTALVGHTRRFFHSIFGREQVDMAEQNSFSRDIEFSQLMAREEALLDAKDRDDEKSTNDDSTTDSVPPVSSNQGFTSFMNVLYRVIPKRGLLEKKIQDEVVQEEKLNLVDDKRSDRLIAVYPILSMVAKLGIPPLPSVSSSMVPRTQFSAQGCDWHASNVTFLFEAKMSASKLAGRCGTHALVNFELADKSKWSSLEGR